MCGGISKAVAFLKCFLGQEKNTLKAPEGIFTKHGTVKKVNTAENFNFPTQEHLFLKADAVPFASKLQQVVHHRCITEEFQLKPLPIIKAI